MASETAGPDKSGSQYEAGDIPGIYETVSNYFIKKSQIIPVL
jgi:hypothetical protein